MLVREWPSSQSSDQNDGSHGTCIEWYTRPPILLWDVIHSHPEFYLVIHVRFVQQLELL